MAKAIKTAAIIVGVAVAGFATAGAAWAIAGGASLGAAAASIGATSIFGAVTASQVISGAFLVAGIAGGFDKPSVPTVGQTDAGSQIEFKADPRAPLPYGMGRTGTGGNLVFDDTAGAKSAYLNQVVVWSAAGPVQEIEAIFANDVALGFPLDGGEGQDGFYIHKMWRRNQLGEPGSSRLVSSTVQAAGGVPSEWTADHKLSGYAASFLSQLYDTTVYSGGPVTWRANGKWVKVYDPRQDSTYPGGSGVQRADDEATWAWNENPYVHALTWLIGRKQNGKRIGLGVYAPLASIDVAAFVQGANVADANGWTIGGFVYSTDDKWEVLKTILQAGGGVPLKLRAKISCFVNTPRVSLATLQARDVIDEVSITAQQPKKTRINTVWPTWRQEAQNWQVQAGDAPITVPDYYAIDGGQRSREITYPLVQKASQVAQLARYDIEDAREFGPCTFPCKPQWLGYRPGDCITADEPEWGLNGQKLLILDRQVDPSSLVVTLTCRSETDGKHAFALGQTQTAPPTPGLTGLDRLLTAPEAGAWEADADLLAGEDGSLPAIIITGAADNVHAIGVILDYRQVFRAVDGTVTYGPWESQEYPADTTRIVLSGLVPGGEYQVRIRYRTAGGATDPAVSLALGAHKVGSVTAYAVKQIEGLTPQQMLAKIQDAAAQGLAAIKAAMDLANTASQAILDAKSIRDRIAQAGFSIDGVPLGPITQDLKVQGADLVASRSLMGLTALDKSAFTLSDTTLKFANGDTVATRFNLLYASDASNASAVAASSAAVATEATARASADTAEANNRLTLAATVNTNLATFNSFQSAQATTNSATSTSITSLTAQVGSNYAAYTSSVTTQAGTNSATASSLTALSATAAGQSSSITNLYTVTAGLGAQAVLSLDYNGNVSGYRFANGASGSSMVFLSGTIGFTDGTGSVYPLTISGGWVSIDRLRVNYIAAGVVDVATLAEGTRSQEVSTFSTGAVTYGTSDTYIAGVTITTKGGRIRITFDCSGDSLPGGTPANSFTRFLLYRDGSFLTSFYGPRQGLGGSASTNYSEAPNAGTHAYSVYAREEGGGGVSYTAFNRFLAAEETVI